MKGCINTWKYNIQNGDEISIGSGGLKTMNGICRHTVSIHVQMNSVECAIIQITK
jgi:hypothetical protein